MKFPSLVALLVGVALRLTAGEQATAIAAVTAGYVTGITVTSGGSGYVYAPDVFLVGGGGTGAQVKVILISDRVSEILVASAGSGYISPPEVRINPPDGLTQSRNPRLLVEGPSNARPVLQVSSNLYYPSGWKPWTTVDLSSGPAESVDLSPLEAGTYYRVLIPAGQEGTPAQASASVTGGLVSKINLSDGGLGYGKAPQVTLTGGGGTGASAIALVDAGRVTAIIVTSAGLSYRSAPVVKIAPPPALRLGIDTVNLIRIPGSASASNQIQYLPNRATTLGWRIFTNVVVGPGGATLVDGSDDSQLRLYRGVPLGPPGAGPTGFAWIDPGEFQMGSSESEAGREVDETQHTVTISKGFWMSDHETTQAEYQDIVGNNPSSFKGGDRPVEQASWDDAVAYCQKLTERERAAGRIAAQQAYRLPTEAEWEYAARAGTTAARYADLDSIAWWSSNSASQTHSVNGKLANAWGLYDMIGNVWEWCSDWYGDYPTGGVSDPTGPNSGSLRLLRGGSWNFDAGLCRSASRYWAVPGGRHGNLGFRPVLSSVR